MNNTIKTDVLIAGCGCSGLYMAMNLPADKKILMITKSDCESSDSFLAQGGMCMLKCEEDYESYFEDTMKAGHYENDKKSVEIMIRSSAGVVKDLVGMSFGDGLRSKQVSCHWFCLLNSFYNRVCILQLLPFIKPCTMKK